MSLDSDIAELKTTVNELMVASEIHKTAIGLLKEDLISRERRDDHMHDVQDLRREGQPSKDRVNEIEERVDSLIVILDQFARAIITWHLHHDPKERL